MSRFMLNFGDVRQSQPLAAAARDAWVKNVLMKDAEWPPDFDHWNPEGTDWGWISSQRMHSDSGQRIFRIMSKHRFKHSRLWWGDECYDLIDQVALPTSIDSTSAKQTDECSICLEDATDDAWAMLICNHDFHQKCLYSWLAIDGRCPMCRQSPIDVEDRIDALKSQGNDLANRGETARAIDIYKQCLSRLGQARPQKCAMLHNNLALMYIHQADGAAALRHAKDVLTSPQTESRTKVKALYRKGKAHMILGDNDRVKEAFLEASKFDPEDKKIYYQLKLLELGNSDDKQTLL